MVKSGFTLLEILVVIAIIGAMAALLLPAVQQAREAARRSACTNNLRQMGLALHNYHATHGVLPRNHYTNNFANANVALLPFFEASNVADLYNYNKPYSDLSNEVVKDKMPANMICPSSPDGGTPLRLNGFQTSDYVYVLNAQKVPGSTQYDPGTFKSCLTLNKIEDGLSNTLFMYESAGRAHVWFNNTQMSSDYEAKLQEVGWGGWATPAFWNITSVGWTGYANGYVIKPETWGLDAANPSDSNPTSLSSVGNVMNNTNYFSAAYSFHPAGMNVLLGDGGVRFLQEQIDAETVIRLSNYNDGKVVGEF